MPLVDPSRFDKNKPKVHRQKKKIESFKLTSDGIKDFQEEFPGITGTREMFTKLKHLKAIGNIWYTSRVSSNKISAMVKDAAALGTGTNLEDVEASGHQHGVKTARMISRTSGGPQQIG